MKRTAFVLSGVFALLCAASSTVGAKSAPQAAASVQGTWKLVAYNGVETPDQVGLYIFTGKHYSITQALSVRPDLPPGRGSLTADQMWATFGGNAFQAQSGTYEMGPNGITVRPMVAKAPSVMKPDYWMLYTTEMKESTLTLKAVDSNTGPLPQGASYTLQRVE